MKMFASLPAVAVAAFLLTAPTVAAAQPRSSSPRPAAATTTTTTADYTERVVEGDQVVKFTGDELAGVENSPYGGTIRRPPGSMRIGLLRPRLNFIPELLKAVENL